MSYKTDLAGSFSRGTNPPNLKNMMKIHFNRLIAFLVAIISLTILSCKDDAFSTVNTSDILLSKTRSVALPFFKGVDLSYVNELEDVGVVYTENGNPVDVYELMNEYGANLLRLRLWHNPTWTNYSTLTDVKKSISRAKKLNMYVLLDFHYSDTWTDPEQSAVPAAWLPVVDDIDALSDSLYNYTKAVLTELRDENLLPDMVQIGNETNNNILVRDTSELLPVNYERNVALFNAGLSAVKEFNQDNNKSIQTVLHVALNLSDAMAWVNSLKQYGINDFDILGLSYYPQWQDYTPAELGEFSSTLLSTYNIHLLVAETGHIWTRDWNDNSQNLMSKMAPGYPEAPCPQLQKDFLIEVKDAVRNNGGTGVIAWEPAWVSADNVTLWGVGSNWENVAWFNFNNELLEHGGIESLSETNVAVTFRVDMSNVPGYKKAYITGEFTADDSGNWQIFPMEQENNSSTYSFTTHLSQGQTGAYYFLRDSVWTERETIPASCQDKWDDRLYQITTTETTQTISNVWASCEQVY